MAFRMRSMFISVSPPIKRMLCGDFPCRCAFMKVMRRSRVLSLMSEDERALFDSKRL